MLGIYGEALIEESRGSPPPNSRRTPHSEGILVKFSGVRRAFGGGSRYLKKYKERSEKVPRENRGVSESPEGGSSEGVLREF